MQVSTGFSDSNRMRQTTSTMGAGIVSGKAFLDMDWIAEAMANGDDKSKRCYPGGAREENHDAMPGYMSFGLKCVRAEQGGEGDTNELGVVSVAGLSFDEYSSQRAMEAQWYFQGFVATEQRVSGHHMDRNTHDPHHGYATIRVGMANTPNNGPFVLYAGQLACWRMPPSSHFFVKSPLNGDIMEDTVINQRARNGDPNTQFRWELVPFDPRDFTMYTAGAIATMATLSSDPSGPGISDMPFSDFFRWEGITEVPAVSCEQEEAAGRKYGFIGAGLAFVETLLANDFITLNQAQLPEGIQVPDNNHTKIQLLAELIGLWKTTEPENEIWFKAIQNMFFMDLVETDEVAQIKERWTTAFGSTPADDGKMQTLNNDPATNYKKLRVHLSRFTDASIIGSWYDKTSKIIGRAANTTAPGDMAHILAGHSAV